MTQIIRGRYPLIAALALGPLSGLAAYAIGHGSVLTGAFIFAVENWGG